MSPLSTPHKTAAVSALAALTESVFVHPGLIHRLTLAERMVLQTRSVQRMSRLRQTGLAYLTIPTNENTRLPHCIGTSYWTARFIERMRSNEFCHSVADGFVELPGNTERLDHLDELLGPELSLDLLARIYALVHDSDLLPFGHTLSYQFGYFAPPGNVPRFQGYLTRIREEIATAAVDVDGVERADVINSLLRHIDAVEAIAVSVLLLAGKPGHHSCQSEGEIVRLLPVYSFVETLVTATVSADLIDFTQRDTLGAGAPWHFNTELLEHAAVFATRPNDIESELLGSTAAGGDRLFRFGFGAYAGGARRHSVVSGVIELLRVRYQTLEQIVYSSGKVTADAMLDKAIRNLNAHHVGDPFDESELLVLGDDQFLDLVEAGESKVSLGPLGSPVIPDLRSRRLFDVAYRIEDRDRLSERAETTLREASVPVERDVLEEQLVKEVPGLAQTDIVVSCLPLTMQMKDPSVLIGWSDGEVLSLGTLAHRGYGEDALGITRRYADLWSFSVCVRSSVPSSIRSLVHEVAARHFER
ncbi:hypothetical protein ACIHIX_45990 [Streptomyces sp. NPDC051913]|uniref:hypothetical protein n=1 Tax=Streptomyces sp. NPDC051913 TaxID=3365676 RepID=UPI0037D25936